MLVLSRRLGERILIGESIEVEVVAVRGRRVRIGITCPGDVRIMRSELLETPLEETNVPPDALPTIGSRRTRESTACGKAQHRAS
jgi:carbon storage regulator